MEVPQLYLTVVVQPIIPVFSPPITYLLGGEGPSPLVLLHGRRKGGGVWDPQCQRGQTFFGSHTDFCPFSLPHITLLLPVQTLPTYPTMTGCLCAMPTCLPAKFFLCPSCLCMVSLCVFPRHAFGVYCLFVYFVHTGRLILVQWLLCLPACNHTCQTFAPCLPTVPFPSLCPMPCARCVQHACVVPALIGWMVGLLFPHFVLPLGRTGRRRGMPACLCLCRACPVYVYSSCTRRWTAPCPSLACHWCAALQPSLFTPVLLYGAPSVHCTPFNVSHYINFYTHAPMPFTCLCPSPTTLAIPPFPYTLFYLFEGRKEGRGAHCLPVYLPFDLGKEGRPLLCAGKFITLPPLPCHALPCLAV